MLCQVVCWKVTAPCWIVGEDGTITDDAEGGMRLYRDGKRTKVASHCRRSPSHPGS
ncbi:MAG: hypothetical protein R2838_00170 [Caldilineaceae bacterium]